MANLYEPIMPKRAQMLSDLLGIDLSKYEPVSYDSTKIITNVPLLFQRLDLEQIDMTKGLTNPFNA